MAFPTYEEFLRDARSLGLLEDFERVCKDNAITLRALCSSARHTSVVRARTEAYKMLRSKWGKSYTEIGQIFGRDHATVMRSIERADKHLQRSGAGK